jgi:hypothetical protein
LWPERAVHSIHLEGNFLILILALYRPLFVDVVK